MSGVRFVAMMVLFALSGCGSERHFAGDTLWPFGNPNAPDNGSENAERALGRTPVITPIAVQAGNVWPGPVQPVPTIADIERNMNQPLGQDYAPSLPSPYPPGQQPQDQDDDLTVPSGNAGAPGAPSSPPPIAAAPLVAPGHALPAGSVPALVPGNPHGRE